MNLFRPWLQRWTARIMPHYIHHRNYINTGNSQATTLRHIFYVVIGTKVAFESTSKALMVAIGIGVISLYWVWGWWWDKNKGYDQDVEWSNRRNPFVKWIEEKLK